MASPTRFLLALLMFPLLSAYASEMMTSVEGGNAMEQLLLGEKQNLSGIALVTSREVRLAPASEKYVEDGIDRYSYEESLTYGAMLALSLVVLRFFHASGVGLFFSLLGNLGKSRLFWLLLLLSLPSLCAGATLEEIARSFIYGVALSNAGYGIFFDLDFFFKSLYFSGVVGDVVGDDLLCLSSYLALIFYHLFTLPSIISEYFNGREFNVIFELVFPLLQFVVVSLLFSLKVYFHGDSIGRQLREDVTAAAEWLLLCCSAVLIIFLF